MPDTRKSSPAAATVDATPSALANAAELPAHCAGFIEGSRPHLRSEITNLLRTRLRAAAGILCLTFGIFFAYRLIAGDTPAASNSPTFYFHFATVVVLGASFFLLCRRCQIPLAVLRGYELAVFGFPLAYIAIYVYQMLTFFAERGYEPNPLDFWVGLMFIYSLFIPNSWRRAAVVLGAMVAVPVIEIGYLWYTHPLFASVVSNTPGFIVETGVTLGITYLAAVYGTYMIGSLRREAFEARQLGQYRLCRPIGSGGMGDVYLAEHQMMKRPVAIKLIRPSKSTDPQALARFEREVRATAKLSHWNTIEIFDYGRADDGTFYYVMEYLPGLSLADLVSKYGPLSPARAIHLLMQTCDALAEAHGRGLVHRDIKPGNVFAAQRGGYYDVAKLLDFGLAKPVSTSVETLHLTQEGSITGSPLYMSPEQATGDELDARSDIYSLGAVAYYLLTGAPPFESDKPIKVILAHTHEPVVPPSQLRSDIPADVEAVVLRCLAKNPADRYQNVVALRRAMADCSAAGTWGHDEAAHWWRANAQDESQPELLETAAL